MIYRGTPRLPSAHAVNLAFERIGGSLYASTQTDYGVFSVTLPPESLDEACALFGEVLRAPAFLDIEVEKGIVCEEILEDLDDEGRQVDADNLSRELIYPTHALGYTITGDEAQVRSFTRRCAGRTTEALRGAERRARLLGGDRRRPGDGNRGARLRRRCRRRTLTRGESARARAEEAAPADRGERLVADRAPRVPARDGGERAASAPRSRC